MVDRLHQLANGSFDEFCFCCLAYRRTQFRLGRDVQLRSGVSQVGARVGSVFGGMPSRRR